MPSWPTGVQTCALSFGKGVTIGGNMTSARLTIDPIFNGTNAVIWAADGTPLLPFTETASATEGAFGSTRIPVVDQAGWLDDGQHTYSQWGYRLTETPYYGSVAGKTRTKFWQPLSGQTSVDFDLIPDGSIGLPVSGPVAVVTSVNGQTGAVTVTGGTAGNYIVFGPTAPDPAVSPVWADTSTTPPTLRGWNGTSFVSLTTGTTPTPTLTNTGQPVISGTPNPGQTLTTTNGSWSATPDSYLWQWRRNGVSITNATNETYLLTTDDLNTSITVTVTASKTGHITASTNSSGVTIVTAPTTDTFMTTELDDFLSTELGDLLTV